MIVDIFPLLWRTKTSSQYGMLADQGASARHVKIERASDEKTFPWNLPVTEQLQLSPLDKWNVRVQYRDMDATHCTGLAGSGAFNPS